VTRGVRNVQTSVLNLIFFQIETLNLGSIHAVVGSNAGNNQVLACPSLVAIVIQERGKIEVRRGHDNYSLIYYCWDFVPELGGDIGLVMATIMGRWLPGFDMPP
jgi:hypothetical protein